MKANAPINKRAIAGRGELWTAIGGYLPSPCHSLVPLVLLLPLPAFPAPIQRLLMQLPETIGIFSFMRPTYEFTSTTLAPLHIGCQDMSGPKYIDELPLSHSPSPSPASNTHIPTKSLYKFI